MDEGHETLTLERRGDHVLLLTLDRPRAGNAMNTRMGYELRDLFTDLYVDQRILAAVKFERAEVHHQVTRVQ